MTRPHLLKLSPSMAWLAVSVTGIVGLVYPAVARSAEGGATLVRVSLSAVGLQANGRSSAAALSADGRYVAFVSWADNLVPGDTNNWSDVFVRDREASTLVRASVSSGGFEAQGNSWAPTISADGRYVAFASDAWNLSVADENEVGDIFVRDLQQGTTIRASISSGGTPADGASTNPALSADGRYVAFESSATNLVSDDGNGDVDVFVRDLVGGTTERVSVGTSGIQALGASSVPAISADGRYVTFATLASNLIGNGLDVNDTWDVYMRDQVAGTTALISVSGSGVQGNGSSFASSLSSDGRIVAFESQAGNLVAGDENGRSDVFVRDLQTGATVRVSVGSAGSEGNGGSTRPAISADGRWIAFASEASNLVSDDGNGAQDVFLHDRSGSALVRVSVTSSGAGAQGGSSWPALSADGRFVAFPYAGSDLIPGDTNEAADVFVRGPLD